MKKLVGLALGVLALGFMLTGCGTVAHSNVDYENEELYSVGNKEYEGEIKEIKINWMGGNVKLYYSSDSKVSLTETLSKSDCEDKYKLHSYFAEGVLYIQPSSCGDIYFNNLKKELQITIPENTYCDSISFNGLSSSMFCNVSAKTYSISTMSGDGEVTSDKDIEKVVASTMSGDVFITCDYIKEANINTMSGNCMIVLGSDVKCVADFSSRSGKKTNECNSGEKIFNLVFDSMSGDLDVKRKLI